MNLFKGAILVGVAACSVSAATSPWIDVGTGQDGTKVTLDVRTLSRSQGVTKVWIQYDYSDVKTVKERTAKDMMEIRCLDHSARTTYSVTYAPDGTVTESKSTPYRDFQPLVPDSVGQEIERVACEAVDYLEKQ